MKALRCQLHPELCAFARLSNGQASGGFVRMPIFRGSCSERSLRAQSGCAQFVPNAFAEYSPLQLREIRRYGAAI